jgi:putative hydrolase of the HAD superfamily
LRVHPRRCLLVEDTLTHQKAARSVGMRTAWLMRYVRGRRIAARPAAGRPAYVDHRLGALRALTRLREIGLAQGRRAHFQ